MSALRKLRQARLVAQQERLQQSGESVEDVATEGKGGDGVDGGDDGTADRHKAVVNAFDLLNEDDEQEDEEDGEERPTSGVVKSTVEEEEVEEEEDEGDEEDEETAQGPQQANADIHPAIPSSSVDASRKKRSSGGRGGTKSHPKKGGQGVGRGKGRQAEKADGGGQSSKGKVKRGEEKGDEDLDEVLRSLDAAQSEGAGGESHQVETSQGTSEVDWAFLSTQQRHLDANTEVSLPFINGRAQRAGMTAGLHQPPL